MKKSGLGCLVSRTTLQLNTLYSIFSSEDFLMGNIVLGILNDAFLKSLLFKNSLEVSPEEKNSF